VQSLVEHSGIMEPSSSSQLQSRKHPLQTSDSKHSNCIYDNFRHKLKLNLYESRDPNYSLNISQSSNYDQVITFGITSCLEIMKMNWRSVG
jgi:hypothetical protein